MSEEARLAFVFWHRPRESVAPVAYERGLAAWHASLRSAAPEGFVESSSFRTTAFPWEAGEPGPPAYVDWYVVLDWAALGLLNRDAVRPPHQRSHDDIAGLSATGQGSIFAHRGGSLPIRSERFETWSSRPDGTTSSDHVTNLTDLSPAPHSIWQRQLSLGPAPEFCVRSVGPPADPARTRREVRPVS